MTKTANNAASSGLGIESRKHNSTPDALTRKSNNALRAALAQMSYLHKQAKSHGIALPNTSQELRDIFKKYDGEL